MTGFGGLFAFVVVAVAGAYLGRRPRQFLASGRSGLSRESTLSFSWREIEFWRGGSLSLPIFLREKQQGDLLDFKASCASFFFSFFFFCVWGREHERMGGQYFVPFD